MTTSSTLTITAIPGFPFVNGINASGTLAGGTIAPDNDSAHQIPLLYSAGQVSTLPTGSTGWGSTTSINDQGVIAGDLFINPDAIPSSANPAVPVVMTEAVIWQNGSYTLLTGYAGDASSGATGINRSGVIVGNSSPDGTSDLHALLWQSATAAPTVLPPLAGDTAAFAWAINDVGTVVGVSEQTYGFAVVWQNGQVSKLATVADETSSFALGINHAGQIIGDIFLNHKQEEAALWQNGAITILADPVGTFSEAYGINDLGQVVGDAADASGKVYAALWQNGQVINLNSLLPANSGWVLDRASAIDDKGDIAGVGEYHGQQVGFMLNLGGSVTVEASASQSAVATYATNELTSKVMLTDSAANVSATLDGLQSLALAGELGTVTLTDSGVPTIALSAHQLVTDAATLAAITSTYRLSVTADSTGGAITAPSGHAMTVVFSANAADYTVTGTANGVEVSGDGAVYQLSGATALHFADHSEILAAMPGTTTVTSGNVTELYAAVLAREPDVAGLSFYQDYLKANPDTPLIQFAEWFLSSTEYSSAHTYAQSTAGDAQFIADSYQNLLGRAPSADDVAFYQSKLLEPAVAGLTAGTAAYAAAQAQAHAQMLVYFSASAEFLKDVQITASQPADPQHWLVLT